ncbi:MAG: ATP-binding protein [Stellaceae bacterium]
MVSPEIDPKSLRSAGVELDPEAQPAGAGKPRLLLGPHVPPHFHRLLGGGIGRRLLIRVLLFSSAVALVLTLLQLYLDYRRDLSLIDQRFEEIERSYLGSLGEGLWNLDQQQLALQLQGVLRLPDIAAAEIREAATASAHPLTIALGDRASRAFIGREFPLAHAVDGVQRQIGTVYVEATLTDVYRRLIDRALIILAGQTAKTFLVSLFIIYIFNRLITRHLAALAKFVGGYDLRHPPPPLRLERRPPRQPDELDRVVAAFDRMCGSLQSAYQDLRHANTRLEQDILARRQAEQALRHSEERLRDYAETASDWFWETGPDHRFTYVSERASALGVLPAEVKGRRRRDLAADPDQEPEKWSRHFETLDQHKPFRGFIYNLAKRDGTTAIVAVSGKPIFDEAGTFAGYRGVATDVTAEVHADQALRASREQELLLKSQQIAAEAERLELLQRLVTVQEEERLRIARDLHDQTGQDLTGLSLGLKSLEPAVRGETALGNLRWLQALATQIAGKLHRYAWELRPTSLDDLGLVRALESYVADWSERFGPRIDFQYAGVDGRRFPPAIETAAYRVVQEALTNVLKHAAADTVSLVLERREDCLHVIVEDDGVGFDPEAATAGRLGIAGMRERLALVGGALTIDSARDVGTTLYIRLPLAGADAKAVP